MEIIAKKINFKKNKEDSLYKFYESFSQLSHDLKNNFVAIRASAGTIKQSINFPVVENNANNIEKALFGIDKKINHSITLINMMTIFSCPVSNWPSDFSNLSILDCIQQSIQSYPFTSEKHASFINITTPSIDFSFTGNKQLINSIFYCLIKNGLRATYNLGNGEISIELDKKNNKVHFKFIENIKLNNSAYKYNLFELGTPKNPGNGLNFIKTVMRRNMQGDIEFKQGSAGEIVITLFFSII